MGRITKKDLQIEIVQLNNTINTLIYGTEKQKNEILMAYKLRDDYEKAIWYGNPIKKITRIIN